MTLSKPIFEAYHFEAAAELFDPVAAFKGYKPNVKERPDGDDRTDHKKRYLHISLKNEPLPEFAMWMLARAHLEACRIAEQINVPAAYYPKIENGTLRVLEYEAGGGSHAHCDFDLFTVNCWRDHPYDLESFVDVDNESSARPDRQWVPGVPAFHLGALGRIVGLGAATPHRVPARSYSQRSIVYFASPAMNTPLPAPITFPAQDGFAARTVHTTGEWQIERTNRSRITRPVG